MPVMLRASDDAGEKEWWHGGAVPVAARSTSAMVRLAAATVADGAAPAVAVAAGWRDRPGDASAAVGGLVEGAIGAVYEVEYGVAPVPPARR